MLPPPLRGPGVTTIFRPGSGAGIYIGRYVGRMISGSVESFELLQITDSYCAVGMEPVRCRIAPNDVRRTRANYRGASSTSTDRPTNYDEHY